MMPPRYDPELDESLNVLVKNIQKRRNTALENFFAKYENCSEDDEVVDLRTMKIVKKAKKRKTQTRSNTVPYAVSYGITEEDKKHLKIIHDKIRAGKKPSAGAESETSFFGFHPLETKSENTTSEVIADGLGQDVVSRKQPSNKKEFNSKRTPRNKAKRTPRDKAKRTPRDQVSLLKLVRRINPIQVKVKRLNESLDHIPIALECLSPKGPLPAVKQHYTPECSSNTPRDKAKRTPRDQVSLLKLVRRINPIQVKVKRLNESLDHIPIALECLSPKGPLPAVKQHYTPECSSNTPRDKAKRTPRDKAKRTPRDKAKRTPRDQVSLLKPVRRINPIQVKVKRLNESLDHIPIALECLSPKGPLPAVKQHYTPECSSNTPRDKAKRTPRDKAKRTPRDKAKRTPRDQVSLLKPVRRINPIQVKVKRLNESLDHIPIALECLLPKGPLPAVKQHYTPECSSNTPCNIPIALECMPPLNSVGKPNTYKHSRRSLFEGKSNSSLNAKLNNSPVLSKSLCPLSSYMGKSSYKSNRRSEHSR